MKGLADLAYDELVDLAAPFLQLRALGEEMTGAMVALIPTDADAARLAVDGGEAVDQLHVTLADLGEGAAIGADTRAAVVARLRGLVEDAIAPDYELPVRADGFALSLFNPTNADRETCIVLGLSGGDIDAIHSMVMGALSEVETLALPQQHSPWVAHLTLVYTDDAARMAELVDRTGPVTFDRLRVAFAGEETDIPLSAPVAATRAAYGQAVLSGAESVRAAAAEFLNGGLPPLPPVPGEAHHEIQSGQE